MRWRRAGAHLEAVAGASARGDARAARAGSCATVLATPAIQRAIDACAAGGGGTVRLLQGDYLCGTIVLRSGVMLEAAGARLLASTNLQHYPEHRAQRPTVQDSNMGMNQSLIFAEGCERIGICGKGLIDGRGTKDNFPARKPPAPRRAARS
jgi:polygalacturonase